MLRRTLTILAVAALAAPALPRADDREWEEDYTDQWSSERPSDYDVSVDLNDPGAVNFDTFQSGLSPYGEWVVVGGYGRVWRPHVAAGWRPYYYGRWEWTSEGWLWVSDEPFGWAAYHYGRWTFDPSYGWVWIPGYQWAPAWVAWRYSGDVVGWAPLGPGVSIYVSSYPFVDTWWTFVPCGSFVSYPVYRVAYAPGHTRRYFYATAPAPPVGGGRAAPGRPGGARPAPGRPAWGGPAPGVIEQRTGRAVTPVRVVPAPAPGAARTRPGEVSIYRPDARSGGRGNAAAPGRAGETRGAPGYAPSRGGETRGAPGNAPSRGGETRGAPGYAPSRGGETRSAPGSAPARGGGRDQAAPPPSRGGSGGPDRASPPTRGGSPRGPGVAPGSGSAPSRGAPGYARQDRGGAYGGSGAPARAAPAARSAPSYAPPASRGGSVAPAPAPSRGGGGAPARAAPAPGGGRGGDRR